MAKQNQYLFIIIIFSAGLVLYSPHTSLFIVNLNVLLKYANIELRMRLGRLMLSEISIWRLWNNSAEKILGGGDRL